MNFWHRFRRVLRRVFRQRRHSKADRLRVRCQADISPVELEALTLDVQQNWPGKILYLEAGGREYVIPDPVKSESRS